ncbi:hypothetical protein PRIC1_000464 [Phytophthora ramorum]
MAQRELIHDLVERSRERVVQVRAGSSLAHVLQQQQLQPQPSASSLPLLPPAPLLALGAKRRPHKAAHGEVANEPKVQRRRNALPRLAKAVAQLPEAASSFEQYQHFMATKIYTEETIHLQNRRVALVPKTDLLKKLAEVCAAALKEMENESDAPVVRESLREKLVRATALLRSGQAFANAKSLAPPPLPIYGQIKNPHLAFLEFKRDGLVASKDRHIHPSAGLQDGNTATKLPIHFGDQICLLSSSSDLPLSIGADGRSRPAKDSSVGPQMTFTIVDFRNPSRYDEVTSTDDFWLRADPAAIVPRKQLDARRLFNSENGEDSDSTGNGNDGDDLASLLSDTSYYLGCPGWLDGGKSNAASLAELAQPVQNARILEDPRLCSQKRFRIGAMKALTPSKEYYGDDIATREYAAETNEGIMRLARWRFVRYHPRRHEQIGKTEHASGGGSRFDSEQDVNDALVNCSTVYLVLSDFALVYDEELKRGVGVHVSSDESMSPEVFKLRENGHDRNERRHRRCSSRDSSEDDVAVANVVHFSACARWQVRILQRTGCINYLQELELAIAAVTGDVRKEDDARVEWLRQKQEKVASNNRRLQAKNCMILDARRQYDLVAAQSNSKLEQIERQKGAQATEYFQRRLQALGSMERAHKPHEIMQLKQQQLHRVVELPCL